MNDTTRRTYEQDRDKLAPKTQEQEFDEAVERVYRAYGSDLSAFISDIKRDLVKQAVNRDLPAIDRCLEE